MQVQAVTLEAERDAVQALDRHLTDQKLSFARTLYALWQRWEPLYRGSRREFIQWFNQGEFSGSHYAYLYSGQAQAAGFAGHRSGVMSQIGQALSDGDTPADIQARLDAGQPARRPQRDVTTLQIPAVLAPELREMVRQVSESDRLNTPEAAARMIQAVGNQRPAMKAALLDTEGTGRPLVDALVYASQVQGDYRAELKKHGCIRCGVTSGVELHHVRVSADERYRTHTYLAPLCQRHHGARPGDSTDSIHAQTFAEIEQDAEFWRKAFIAMSDAAEATRPQGES